MKVTHVQSMEKLEMSGRAKSCVLWDFGIKSSSGSLRLFASLFL